MSSPQLEGNIIFWLIKNENNQTKYNINFNRLSICFFFLFEKIIECNSQPSQVILKLILNGIAWKL